MKMLSDKEKIELFCKENKFDPKLIQNYIKFILDTFDRFRTYCDSVNEMERMSDVVKTLNKYHSEALKYSSEYRKMYEGVIDEYFNEWIQEGKNNEEI